MSGFLRRANKRTFADSIIEAGSIARPASRQ
jgi:hypothetical protein